MHALANNVLGRLKYAIAGGALSLVVEPMPNVNQWAFPSATTDAAAGPPTYGEPFGVLTIMDVTNEAAAKIENILYSARTPGVGADAGCFVYTVVAGGRGWEGSGASAWVPGVKVLQVPTRGVLGLETKVAVARATSLITHKRDAVMTWDGANFKFDTFVVHGAGRGRHWGADGYFTITMPANGTTVKGFGGAADSAVAAGAIPIAAKHALYFELYISGPNATIAGNFKLVATTGDFVVPPHWILLAVHSEVAAGEKCLRVANGATLFPWRDVATEGLFVNAWVNEGSDAAAYRKDAGQIVEIKGLVKSGVAVGIFTLPAGFRPSALRVFATTANGGLGELRVSAAGLVSLQAGSGSLYASLDPIRFLAEN